MNEAFALGKMTAGAYKKKRYAYRGKAPRYTRRAASNRRTGGFIGLENKFIDTEINNEALTTSWATHEQATFDSLSATAIGDTESTRDGRVYHINSLHFKYRYRIPATEAQVTPPVQQNVRLLLVWDTQSNGAQLTATNVMDAGGTNDVLSFRNLQFTKRFRVLYDRTMNIKVPFQGQGGVDLFANQQVLSPVISVNRQFKTPIKVNCSGTTAAIGSITDNSLHCIAIGSTALPLLSFQCRVRFSG